MSLTKSKGNMYEWTTHHWSPIKGCKHHCPYCYTQQFDKNWDKPRMDEKDLLTKLSVGRRPYPKTIFVGSKCDMWGAWVPDEWIQKVLNQCRQYPENQYVFQSKNPGRFALFLSQIPQNSLLGTTIETDAYPHGFKIDGPSPVARAYDLKDIQSFKKFVTIEPIMKFNLHDLLVVIRSIHPEFVTIGADSKSHNLPEPTWEEVMVLVDELQKFTEIRTKRNLERLERRHRESNLSL